MAQHGGIGGAAVALLLSCTTVNPDFEGPAASTSTTSPSSTLAEPDPSTGDPDTATTEAEGLTSTSDGTTGSLDSSGSAEADTVAAESSTGAPDPVIHVFPANLTACVHPPVPDPAACERASASGYFQIDGDEPSLGGHVNGYVRFQIDADFQPDAVESVILRMHSHPLDPGSPVGEIWEVAPFTYDSLFMGVPDQLALLAPSFGDIDESLVVEWELPPWVVAPGQPLHLGMFTESSDGSDYNDAESDLPPELIVTVL